MGTNTSMLRYRFWRHLHLHAMVVPLNAISGNCCEPHVLCYMYWIVRSGVLPISVATDGINFSCAFDCAFCPNEIVANGAPRDMARSYLSSEGTFIRGAVENFEAAGQIWRRLLELEFMGHPPDKLEIIVLGGTWDSYEPEYREHFITQIFYACNVFHRFSMRMNGDLTPLTHEWAKQSPFQKGLSFDAENNIKSQLRPAKSLDEEKAENQVLTSPNTEMSNNISHPPSLHVYLRPKHSPSSAR
eukprot:2236202-Pyramimonas_sp.AAC.2